MNELLHLTERACFPVGSEVDLLRGLLSHDDAAREPLTQWLNKIEIEKLPWAERRMLPMVFDKLSELGIESSGSGRLAGVKRHAFVSNTRLFHAARPVLAALVEADCAPILWKGMPLSQLYYTSPAHRPMSDIDVVVKANSLMTAIDVLFNHGWKTKNGKKPRNAVELLLKYHDFIFCNDQSLVIDLKFHIGQTTDSIAQELVRAEAISYTPGPDGVLVPTAPDHLLLIMQHGMFPNSVRPFRWIVDSFALINSQEIDWMRFEEMAKAFGIAPMLGHQLSLLRCYGAPTIPDDLIQRMVERPALPVQKRMLDCSFSLKKGLNLRETIFHHFYFFAVAKSAGVLISPISYLVEFVRLQIRKDTPLRVARLIARTMRKR
jgi:hypothetical protein